MSTPAGTAAARNEPSSGVSGKERLLKRLWRPFASLYSHYHAYHEYGPPRLKYMGWLGVFIFSSFYFLRFTRNSPDLLDDIGIRLTCLILMFGMALRNLWPRRLRRYYIPFTYVALTFSLPFFTAFVGFERGGGMPSISNSFMALCFLTLLVDWRNIIAMVVTGVGLAVVTFKITSGGASLPSDMIAQLPAFLMIVMAGYLFKYSTELVEVERQLRKERQDTERRLAALRESLGFMAHELNTPLAAVRGSISFLAKRLESAPTDATNGSGVSTLALAQRRPGEIAEALERANRSALYCQSLVSAFVQTARDAFPGAVPQRTTASELVRQLLKDYPFEHSERGVVTPLVRNDFELLGRRDLIYLVLCTVLKNALLAVRERDCPAIQITIEEVSPGEDQQQARRGVIRFQDNGAGIAPEVLEKLTHEPITTRGASGTGIGLLLCRRVMESIGGSVEVTSAPDLGASVILEFDLERVA